jgi:hypothetical protein
MSNNLDLNLNLNDKKNKSTKNKIIDDKKFNKFIEDNSKNGLNENKEIIANNNIKQVEYQRINIDSIEEIQNNYPEEFIKFYQLNYLKPPKNNSGNGKALTAMLYNPYKYWDRETCDEFVKKFNINTADSIQLFNKHSQWGILTNSGIEKGKLYIIYPYSLSNKHKMRKNFKYNGNENDKNIEIEKIKSTIKNDYIDILNEKWQLGHKNPGSIDNTNNNLILQPPIQSKYRDDYLFFDTLTKMPLPHKLDKLLKSKEIKLTNEQIQNYKNVLAKYEK